MKYNSILILVILLLAALRVAADGMMVPIRPEVPRFTVAYHRVKVNIDHQVATTDIDQAFHNNARNAIEANYIFPIGEGMTISKFAMYVNNEPLAHRVLEKAEARRIYNGIVSARQDPALLEWLGARMIQARVFPINPGEDKRIRISYQEVLKAQSGVVKYVYPLKTEKLSAQNLKECSVEIAINSAQPIRSVYSPTHNVTVDRKDEHHALVTYSEKNTLPDQDLVLYYTVSEKDLGLDLLTYRDNDKGDGYFLLLAAPKAELDEKDVQPKDVVFVLDKSGSMAGDSKIEQAKSALKYCLNSLNAKDRFNVIVYNEDVRRWSKTDMEPADRAHIKDAEEFVNDCRADGSTNINDALQMALKMLHADALEYAGRPRSVIFLTDGLPTAGETNIAQILANTSRANKNGVRIFDFGVGYDYNAHFLDKLAEQNHGYAENVLPKDNLETKVTSFYAKIAAPLLMNVAMNWGNADVYDIYPKTMPDMYQGSQVIICGRYKIGHSQMLVTEPGYPESIKTSITLTGKANGKSQSFTYPVRFPSSALDDDFIPRLWATRKIGYLEDQVRLNGADKEVVEEIIRLSKEFGILTEYTSFLVDMDMPVRPGEPVALNRINTNGPRVMSKAPADLTDEYTRRVGEKRKYDTGASGVAQSVNTKAGAAAPQAAPARGNYIQNEAGERVRLSQMQNVARRNFLQVGEQWVDINYNQQKVVKVKLFSPAYMQLANAHPGLAQMLSQGKEVTVALKDVALQTGTEGQDEEFTPAEFKELKTKIDAELGVAAAQAGVLPLAVAMPPARVPGWTWWALAIVPPALLARRRFAHRR